MSDSREYWFPAKRYGWGWGFPRRWEGWVVLGVYFGLFVIGAIALQDENPPAFLLFAGAITIVFLAICWWKGEPPRWRWGGD